MSAERDAAIAGLREAADYLEAHPELPVSRHWDLTVHTGAATGIDSRDDAAGTAQVNAAADALGVEPSGTTHYRATRRFGGIAYEVLHIDSRYMDEYEAKTSYDGNVQVERRVGGGQ